MFCHPLLPPLPKIISKTVVWKKCLLDKIHYISWFLVWILFLKLAYKEMILIIAFAYTGVILPIPLCSPLSYLIPSSCSPTFPLIFPLLFSSVFYSHPLKIASSPLTVPFLPHKPIPLKSKAHRREDLWSLSPLILNLPT